ncbi:hypothetical protein VTJ83DRAFT_4579 [Remersonia thermophila]|uniref:Uncharacterized protein n=1 Tax=Remersonia thermophila TaxID=72144 RepID=A0ABR4DCI3_9PEZI
MSTPQESRFLSLPAEIRLAIYRHVFAAPNRYFKLYNPPDPGQPHRRDGHGARQPSQWTALIYTCRQVYAESIGLVYSARCIILSDKTPEKQLEKVQRFLETIGPANARCVTRLELNLPELEYARTMSAAGKTVFSGMDLASQADMACLRILQERCPGLQMLIYSIPPRVCITMYSLPSMMAFLKEPMSRVDAELRRFPLLSTVGVLFGCAPSAAAAKQFQELGWGSWFISGSIRPVLGRSSRTRSEMDGRIVA